MTYSPPRSTSAELDAIKTRMGELASLLSEVADALTSYPESIRIVDENESMNAPAEAATIALSVREWPSLQEIEQLLANWRQLQRLADASVRRRG